MRRRLSAWTDDGLCGVAEGPGHSRRIAKVTADHGPVPEQDELVCNAARVAQAEWP